MAPLSPKKTTKPRFNGIEELLECLKTVQPVAKDVYTIFTELEKGDAQSRQVAYQFLMKLLQDGMVMEQKCYSVVFSFSGMEGLKMLN